MDDSRLLDSLKAFPDLQARYREIMAMSYPGMHHELAETVTGALIDYVCDGTNASACLLKLRVMLTAVRLLLEAESPVVTLRWFANSNPMLGGAAPAGLLRTGGRLGWVIRSAAVYAADGI
ncbi:MAG: hypothetical protein ABI670_08865 [Chloroflexota bacterium]